MNHRDTKTQRKGQQELLLLLQLASPILPLGAYSYSEGLESLVESGAINSQECLETWLERELNGGAIRIESALMLRAYRCVVNGDLQGLGYWNAWLSAARETLELRQQSWQMGGTLIRLLLKLEKSNRITELAIASGTSCNYAIAFGITAASWQIEEQNALLGYLHSWATNLINAGVKLIPLGQTQGQQILLQLNLKLVSTAQEILTLEDDDLVGCSWGLAFACMAHETQYTRLFRS